MDKGIHIGGSVSQSQINTGDNSTLTGTWSSADDDKFNEFIKRIEAHPDIEPDDKKDAIEALTELRAKKQAGTLRASYLKRVWDMLPEAVQLLAGAVELFHVFNAGI